MPKLFGWRCLIKCVFFSCIVPESVGFVSSSVCACVILGGGRGRGFWGYVKGSLIKISRTVPWRILPYISYQVFAVPSGRVFAPFWFENGYTLCSFWSGIVYGFRGNYGAYERIYRFNSKWVRKKEKYANSKIEPNLRNFFVGTLI